MVASAYRSGYILNNTQIIDWRREEQDVDFLHNLFGFIKEYWDTIALMLTWAGIGFVYFRRRVHWRSKRFMNQVNFSLNYFQDGKLAMRTLMETSAQHVWLNDYGIKLVTVAADRATITQPFILLNDEKDMHFVNRAVVNTLSERFAEAFIARALGKPVCEGRFYFVITCEKYVEIRTLKLRVLIMSEKTLTEDFAPGGVGAETQIADPVLKARQTTLKGIYRLFEQDREQGHQVVGQVDLGIPE